MQKQKFSFQQIESAACIFYGITPADLRNKIRNQESARRRYATIHLARTCGRLSTPAIAKRLGWKDHTSVIHGTRRAGELIDHVPTFARDVAAVKEILEHIAALSLSARGA